MQRRYRQQLLLFSTYILLITIIYTIFLMNGGLHSMDEEMRKWFSSWATPILVEIFEGITFLAYTKMLAILSFMTILFLVIRKLFYSIFVYLMVMGGGVIITFLMKIFIERDRPGDISYIDFWGFGSSIISYSFPSGHAVKALLFFGFLIYLLNRRSIWKRLKYYLSAVFVLIILLIGIGQVVLDRHYVSDVIGGYLVALVWLFFCLGLFEREKVKKNSGLTSGALTR